ncbi:hypothetical protein Tco_0149256 [Tanacetum coccineum]
MNPEGDQVRINVNRPLPLSGPPGHVTILTQFFFNKDLEYLRYGSKGSSPTLSIYKMKAASYPDFGLELLVPERMWIDDVSDFQEHTIAKKDFKKPYPSDFEDLNLLLLQGHLDHLLGLDKRMLSTAVKLWTRNLVIRQRVEDLQLSIESYQIQLNLTKPGWDATRYEFKHDYTIIESPRAVVFPVDNNNRKIMRFNEIYKFNDGTLTRILEALDYRVKEFKVKRLNPVGFYSLIHQSCYVYFEDDPIEIGSAAGRPIKEILEILLITGKEVLNWEEFEALDRKSDSFPPGSDDTDFDSEGDLHLIEELLNNDPSSPLPLSPLTFKWQVNDDLPFDIESDLREIEYLLNNDPTKEIDSILEDSVDEGNLADDLVDTIPEMFTDEHTLDYSSPPLYDDVDDDLV